MSGEADRGAPPGAGPGLALEGLGLDYSSREGKVRAFEGLDAFVPAGSIAAVVGPSGCGKTSLVRVAAGLLAPSRGRVSFSAARQADPAATPMGPRRAATGPGTAVIFQDYGLLPWKSAEANAELPLLLAGMPRPERRRRAARALEEMGLAGFGRFFPGRLSGGMRQRLALARALVQEPELLVMDEPFSSLDALTREAAQETLLETQARHGTTVLLVTHSIEEAAYLADAVYVMRYRNPGRLVARIPAPAGKVRGPSFRSEPAFLECASAIRRALEGGEP